MKCYYEILEIARDADDSEIKTAYRKLALRWHPDKNLDNSELAKEQFQLVQQAYEVLSDRHERAWYDNHREQILRGSDSTYEDNSLDVFQYFTTQCFKGYNDDEKGFYTVYRNVFEQIAKEDIEYMDSKSDYDEIPTFGSSTSDYEEIVAPFYAYWMSYCTKKSYVWLDPYNINETRERRVLKLIEKENKKVRQKAKKERNEEIRNLVAFVRKRDKRVQAYAKKLETKNAENRVKHEERRKQKILERKKEIHTKQQADWSKFDNVQKELKEIEKNLAAQFGEVITDSDENSEEENEDLYCVACNKVFKNPKAFANHESSKKHKDNVEKLKLTMLEEENEFEDIENISSEIDNISSVSSKNEEINLEDFEYSSEETNSSVKKKCNEIKEYEENEIDASISSDTEEIINISSKKRNKKNKKVIRINNEHLSDHESDEETKIKFEEPKISDDDFDFGSSKNQKKKKNKNKTPQEPINKQINTENGDETNEKTPTNTKKQTNNKIKLNKTKIPVDIDDIDTSHVCVTCKSNFNSKNKLFDHLKKTGHSVLIPQQKTSKSKKKLK